MQSLVELSLNNNPIGNPGAIALAHCISAQALHSQPARRLFENGEGKIEGGAAEGGDVGDGDAEGVAGRLQRLQLKQCAISDEGAKALAIALTTNSTTDPNDFEVEVDLSLNGMISHDAPTSFLREGLERGIITWSETMGDESSKVAKVIIIAPIT